MQRDRTAIDLSEEQKTRLRRLGADIAKGAAIATPVLFLTLWVMDGDWQLAFLKCLSVPVFIMAITGLAVFEGQVSRAGLLVRAGFIGFNALIFSTFLLLLSVQPDASVDGLFRGFCIQYPIVLLMFALFGFPWNGRANRLDRLIGWRENQGN